MSLLDQIKSPHDVQQLAEASLPSLTSEIRNRIIHCVSKTGGHLAPSLGTVDLTLALAKVFDFDHDKLVWDVGHQSYAWKIITGRNDLMPTLRQFNGLRGFPCREESPYDHFIGGHAGVAISAALGMAAARDRLGQKHSVIAVVGDASLTNGISLEALNAIRHTTAKFILVINDNQMSIAKNVGAVSQALAKSISNYRYNRIRQMAINAGHTLHFTRLKTAYHTVKNFIKHIILRNRSAIFEDLGIRYLGPTDGHDLNALINALRSAQESDRPVVIHISTIKGKGFKPAELNPSYWHGVGPFNPEQKTPPLKTTQPSYSATFGQTLCELASKCPDLVAITAAMPDGTGLRPLFEKCKSQAFDVGICEEHACVFAAGLATQGLRPFVAIYSSFMQRAIDCIMHDICLQKLPVTLCLDRSGAVGADGPTHQGIYDIAMLRTLPNLTIMQPASLAELALMVRFAATFNGPLAIRYPKGNLSSTATPSPIILGEAQIITPTTPETTLAIWALGDTVPIAETIAQHLIAQGIETSVVNARFVKPLDKRLLAQQAAQCTHLVTFENAALAGGFGSAILEALALLPNHPATLTLGWPDQIIPQGDDLLVRKHFNLHDEGLLEQILAHINGAPKRG